MRHGTFYSHDLKSMVMQVNKPTAKKLLESGRKVYIQSCNMQFDNMWQRPFTVSKLDNYSFETVVNSYTYYNCDNERGKYPCFFVKV